MAKLLEKNGAEMMTALVNIAAPIKRLMEDEEFDLAWKNATRKGLENHETDILKIYVEIVPLLLGEKHIKDTLSIIAEIEGTPVSKMMKMNGTELLADVLKAYKEQLIPFFTQLGLSVGMKQ